MVRRVGPTRAGEFPVFNRITDILREKGIYRTGDQCRENIKKMKLEYRHINDNHRMIGADANLHGLPGGAFGSAASGGFLFGHPPRPGELLEINCEDAESENGLLNSDAASPELLYHIGFGDEHDTNGKSAGLDQEGPVEMVHHQGFLQEGYTQYHTDKYHDNDPNGIINMGTSENKLCYDLLHKRGKNGEDDDDDDDIPSVTREEVSRFLSHNCGSPDPLRADKVVVMNGCGSLFSSITTVLCDPEDAILISTPFYGVIPEDVHLYSGAPVSSMFTSTVSRPFHLTVERLEEAMRKATSEGVNVRAVILVNPHNPLAEVYSPPEITGFLEFAKRHELHTIVDEVYVLTVFEETATFHRDLSMERTLR
ncbi:unnamed protein product [Coregonus sp. 'balchen']|nr:unnamed protein product [Coregonus sp. 'balchen']